jgi:predicted DCC family thiol-disulfide oxidoreductase YuxK
MVLLDDGQVFIESAAVLRLASYLAGPWKYLAVLNVVPSLIRDPVYRSLAKHRYQWFGRADTCLMPTDDIRDRFL